MAEPFARGSPAGMWLGSGTMSKFSCPSSPTTAIAARSRATSKLSPILEIVKIGRRSLVSTVAALTLRLIGVRVASNERGNGGVADVPGAAQLAAGGELAGVDPAQHRGFVAPDRSGDIGDLHRLHLLIFM